MNFKGQGSLEYILLIAGAILGAAVVIGIFILVTQSSGDTVDAGSEGGDVFIDSTIGDIRTGLGGPDCGPGPPPNGDGILTPDTQEECWGSDFGGKTCIDFELENPLTGPGLECGTLCNIRTDNCVAPTP